MNYTFNISLSVLNHLGRNLYRSFLTVIGEAISNSWDADANNVWIEIDRDAKSMHIIDDGIGMSSSDFQNKFLKIGYSKRKDDQITTSKNRPFIGRKGIGKLALLSCANRIQVASKAKDSEIVGGLIDNTGLDKAISDDLNAQDYELGVLSDAIKKRLDTLESGTAILFEDISEGIYNTIEYLRKAIAMNFRFSLIDTEFSIFLNGTEVTEDALDDLAKSTQFVWQVNEADDPYLKNHVSPAGNNSVKSYKKLTSPIRMYGFLATTHKPSDLKIHGTKERVSLDLFVNGRLRERDLLKHMPTSRIVENYLYGQIHYDALDNKNDIFTSSREGVLTDDPLFKEFLIELESIVRTIIDEWDKLREKEGNDGDPDNGRITPKQRKAKELFSATVNEIIPPDIAPPRGIVERWVAQLREEAQFNIPSYTECFIAENLLRQHIRHNKISLTKQSHDAIKTWRSKEQEAKKYANISYDVRQIQEDLQYLSMNDLANLVDKPNDKLKDAGIARDAIIYKPLRDAVGHTSILTDTAKTHLTIVFTNIQARLRQLLSENSPQK